MLKSVWTQMHDSDIWFRHFSFVEHTTHRIIQNMNVSLIFIEFPPRITTRWHMLLTWSKSTRDLWFWCYLSPPLNHMSLTLKIRRDYTHPWRYMAQRHYYHESETHRIINNHHGEQKSACLQFFLFHLLLFLKAEASFILIAGGYFSLALGCAPWPSGSDRGPDRSLQVWMALLNQSVLPFHLSFKSLSPGRCRAWGWPVIYHVLSGGLGAISRGSGCAGGRACRA